MQDKIESLCSLFREYAGKLEDVSENGPLEDYLVKWLQTGEPLIESGDDFGIFLSAVICIIDEWLQDPAILDFQGGHGKAEIKRRPGRIFAPDVSRYTSEVFDPWGFRVFPKLIRQYRSRAR